MMSDLVGWVQDSSPKETLNEWKERGEPTLSKHQMWACLNGLNCSWYIVACSECNFVALYLRHNKREDAEERVLVHDERHYGAVTPDITTIAKDS